MTVTEKHFKGHYDQQGHGAPILCLAGFGCSNWIFEGLANKLQDSFCFIMPDNRGMGKSPKASEPYSIEDLAEDALQLMTDLGHEQFHVIGISMGGFLALALSLLEPQRVLRLILMCATAAGDDFVPLPEVSEEMLIRSYACDATTVIRLNTEMTTHGSLQQRDPEVFAQILHNKLLFRADRDQLLLQSRAVNRFLEKELALSQITAPCLLLSGDNDQVVDCRNSSILTRKLRDARVVLITETNHLFFLEKRDEVCAHILAFLECP